MTVWFTGDTHFDHTNIIKYCNRPFKNVDEMNETIIERWNSKVNSYDDVYHVGDFAFRRESFEKFYPSLKGKIHLIRGNHDPGYHVIRDIIGNYLPDILELKINGFNLVLCHYAMRVWNRSHYGSINLYGHSHGTIAPTSQSCDVGVDCWDFYPVTLSEIRDRMAKYPAREDPFEPLMETGELKPSSATL